MNILANSILVPFPRKRPWPEDDDWSQPEYKPGTPISTIRLAEGGQFGGQLYVTCLVDGQIVGRLAAEILEHE